MLLRLGWGLNLGFGIDFDHGFFFVVNQDPAQPELHVDASVDLPSLSGNLLFLALKAEDKHPGDDLDVHFNLDLTNSGSDEKVGLTDLGNLGVNVGLTGNADVDLGLRLGIKAGADVNNKSISALPSLVAEFKLQASMNLGTATAATNNSPFDLSYVAFENIGLDLGSFFSDFLKPLVKGIQDVTNPLQPFIDVFTSPIPVISDLAGQPITLLDIAGLFGEVDPGMIEAVADFIDFPFLKDPSQIIGALFGRPFTLVTIDLPPFTFGFSYSQFFPIIGPLGASITGSLSAKFDFAFGYDSFGLQKFAEGGFKYPLDIFRGFYISDTDHADGTGSD